MKKNLILTTALFAGTMLISNEVCADNILNQNGDQENRKRTHPQMIESNEPQEEGEIKRNHEHIDEQEQGNLEKGAINSNFGSGIPTERFLKIRENICQLFDNPQIKEIEIEYPDLIQNIWHNMMISNNEDELKFAIEKVEKFFEITHEYGYENLEDYEQKKLFDEILKANNNDELEFTRRKVDEFLQVVYDEWYENLYKYMKDEICKKIFESKDDDELEFTRRDKVNEFLHLTTEYSYKKLKYHEQKKLFDEIFNAKDDHEAWLARRKVIQFIDIVNMNGYENITDEEKDDILNDILGNNDSQLLNKTIQQIIEKYHLQFIF